MEQNKASYNNNPITVCQNCGGPTRENERFCIHCGAPTNKFEPQNMVVQCIYGPPVPTKPNNISFVCKKCGAAASDFEIRCKVCGGEVVFASAYYPKEYGKAFSPEEMHVQTVYAPPLPPKPTNKIKQFFFLLKIKLQLKSKKTK